MGGKCMKANSNDSKKKFDPEVQNPIEEKENCRKLLKRSGTYQASQNSRIQGNQNQFDQNFEPKLPIRASPSLQNLNARLDSLLEIRKPSSSHYISDSWSPQVPSMLENDSFPCLDEEEELKNKFQELQQYLSAPGERTLKTTVNSNQKRAGKIIIDTIQTELLQEQVKSKEEFNNPSKIQPIDVSISPILDSDQSSGEIETEMQTKRTKLKPYKLEQVKSKQLNAQNPDYQLEQIIRERSLLPAILSLSQMLEGSQAEFDLKNIWILNLKFEERKEENFSYEYFQYLPLKMEKFKNRIKVQLSQILAIKEMNIKILGVFKGSISIDILVNTLNLQAAEYFNSQLSRRLGRPCQCAEFPIEAIISSEFDFNGVRFQYKNIHKCFPRYQGQRGNQIRVEIPGSSWFKFLVRVLGEYDRGSNQWLKRKGNGAWISLYFAKNNVEFLKFGINKAIHDKALPIQQNLNLQSRNKDRRISHGIVLYSDIEVAAKELDAIKFGEEGWHKVCLCVKARPGSVIQIEKQKFVVENPEDVRITAVIMKKI